MSQRQRKLFACFTVLCMAVAFAPTAGAMHIMEGYLSPPLCIAWGAVCLPFLALGLRNIRRKTDGQSQNLLLLALCGAFVFVISSLKTVSYTHLTLPTKRIV